MPDWPPALTACPRCGTTVAIPIHPGDVIPTRPDGARVVWLRIVPPGPHVCKETP